MDALFVREEDGFAVVAIDGIETRVQPGDKETVAQAASRWALDAYDAILTVPPTFEERVEDVPRAHGLIT